MGPSPSFSEQFDRLSHWRKSFAAQMASFREWLAAHELLDAAVQEQLQRLENLLRGDKVSVAFVAEFSRGKSELINAVFFSHYGRRIMPASPGRTTMCPTELSYDTGLQPCLRLLPIETRAQPYSLAEWRERPSTWVQLPLDVDDADQLAQTMAHVAQVRKVPVDEARQLGFWSDEDGVENPLVDAQGLVEIPKWRHALINMAHPLLRQGLVIVDTPGLNAVGTEPELTVNLIAQAHAVVFVLAADTGVTKSDLAIWKELLQPCHREGDAHLVVLNKIDTLWGSLDSGTEVKELLNRQRRQSAQILDIDPARIVPLSAQKGLVAKIESNTALLQKSGLPLFEDLLAQGILAHRQSILRSVVGEGMAHLQQQVLRSILIRRRDLDEQMLELRSLRGKNTSMIGRMRQRIEQEQQAFENSTAKILALRTVHLKLMNQAFHLLGATSLRKELEQLSGALEHSGLKVGVRKVYASTFERLRDLGAQVRAAAAEVQTMLAAMFRELNAEFGFSLQPPGDLQLHDFERELAQIEESYLQYLSFGNTLKLANPMFGQRMLKALGMRLRAVFESAANDLDLWSKSATAQLDAQLKERKRSFARRMEAVDRIHEAASGLAQRIAEIESAEQQLDQLEQRLAQWAQQLLQVPQAQALESAVVPEAV
ncbi:dynamin family protein [Comamonas kerstersii]|uniref:dynamin family protein n=1 Tax=Comamonas kerstersii TaxID=225992 RepID=UPI00215C585D|nr:dynamin family protein [Comamonas kerstersii]